MEARKVFWKKSYLIKKSPQWTICGYSRSAFRTGFYINGLNIMLDAGPQCFKKPGHIFITHSHADHIANLPFTLIGDEESNHKYNVYVPKEAEDRIKRYVASMFEANALCDIDISDWYNFHSVSSDSKSLSVVTNKNKLNVEIIKCDHCIPTVSYGFGLVKKKLNPKYLGKSGKELGQLRKEGVDDISIEVTEKIFCYVCDTSIDVLKENPFILDYSTIFIECTFIIDGQEEDATKKKHIHWNQLKPYVIDNPDTTFVLFHFSLKYRDEEIKEIMDEKFIKDDIKNVELWLPDLD